MSCETNHTSNEELFELAELGSVSEETKGGFYPGAERYITWNSKEAE